MTDNSQSVKCCPHLPDRERWNERYRSSAGRDPADGPAAVLRLNDALLAGQPRGSALDVACGRGRNAFFLAGLGFSVDAVDVSDMALAELAGRAQAAGLPLRVTQADLRDGALPGSGYQVIVDTFFLERSLLPRLAAVLAPGGLLFLETFLAFEDRPDTGHPYVLERGELQTAFAGLEPVSYGVHQPEGDSYPIARFVARRPPGVDSRPA